MRSAAKPSKGTNFQVVLLRVGIDTGSGGMLGPIFANGSFEFIPIDAHRDRLKRTYANTEGRHGRKLIEYFPNRLKERMKNSLLHLDPEFDTFTYGDPTSPKQSLKDLRAGAYNDLMRAGTLKPFAKNWHILNEHEKERFDKLVLVKGGRGSRLLEKAVKISADEKAIDRGGHPVFILDSKMKKHFGSFTDLNAIQRSTPRWVKPQFCDKAAAFVTTLW